MEIGNSVMKLLAPITELASAVRDFVAPRYRPELYYMRGPGPAYARRMGMLELQHQKPPFGGNLLSS
jgi:hypothetical protein